MRTTALCKRDMALCNGRHALVSLASCEASRAVARSAINSSSMCGIGSTTLQRFMRPGVARHTSSVGSTGECKTRLGCWDATGFNIKHLPYDLRQHIPLQFQLEQCSPVCGKTVGCHKAQTSTPLANMHSSRACAGSVLTEVRCACMAHLAHVMGCLLRCLQLLQPRLLVSAQQLMAMGVHVCASLVAALEGCTLPSSWSC
jgi:hypothetical protein